jgi:hypothetical protein
MTNRLRPAVDRLAGSVNRMRNGWETAWDNAVVMAPHPLAEMTFRTRAGGPIGSNVPSGGPARPRR